MQNKIEILQNLVRLSHNLGSPEKDYVILGDGNSSARIDESTFWVKASGVLMKDIQTEQFVEMRTATVLKMLERDHLTDLEIAKNLTESKLDTTQPHPSIESVFHALAITLCGALYVGHTHPSVWLGILCSKKAEHAVSGRIFPEQINICGPAALFISYDDPGLPLARRIRDRMLWYQDEYGENPKEILLQNHGLIALGQTPAEVENITAMSVRAALALQMSYSLGGPRFLQQKDIERIHDRSDEAYRRHQANR
jgi:rhamnose utilization protein RhaD (predicted bifunctional aldolase and dehydrogenase)